MNPIRTIKSELYRLLKPFTRSIRTKSHHAEKNETKVLQQNKHSKSVKWLAAFLFGWIFQSSQFTSVRANLADAEKAYNVLEVKIASVNSRCEERPSKKCNPVLYRISPVVARNIASLGSFDEASTASWLLGSDTAIYDKQEVLKRRISLETLQDLSFRN
ncbi:MAG: hypothetical protein COT74_06835 [Bdellovibrionales bacterium CG10_big_fil_rev_8_21_14_0_10_45_34]|nr:MAG: hypothetical protein COT74_06835 [Bdellovibrionales bacterium CG10_big_fil_rev_8_21_14_0_10_45_34]